jgi:hypothetical protein
MLKFQLKICKRNGDKKRKLENTHLSRHHPKRRGFEKKKWVLDGAALKMS